jgi:hypothetical protein
MGIEVENGDNLVTLGILPKKEVNASSNLTRFPNSYN